MVRASEPPWVPGSTDYRAVFAEQNPWHETGQVPGDWAPPTERALAHRLPDRLLHDEPRRFQLVLGPRRVGKTTALYQTARDLLRHGVAPERLWWLRLDHPLLMQVPLGGLVQSVMKAAQASREAPLFLFLDELAHADRWDLWLKTFYDDRWPVRIAASSSSTAALRERRTESGVGRWDEQFLTPYLFLEYLDLVGRSLAMPVEDSLASTVEACIAARVSSAGLTEFRTRFLLTGGFPELLLTFGGESPDDATALLRSQRVLRSDAVERAVYKDIPQVFGVDNPLMLERLLYVLAGQIGGVLSPTSLCQQLGSMSQPTFDKYLSYLERSFLVFTLPNYSGSELASQKRGRKLYFVDSAVRNAALQRGMLPLADAAEMGLLLENMAAGHLYALAQQSGVRLFFWREGKDEVDLIFDHPSEPLAFEIASSGGHRRRGLNRLAERFPQFRGRCWMVTGAGGTRPVRPSESSDGVGVLPLDLFLLAVSAQAARDLARRIAPMGGPPP